MLFRDWLARALALSLALTCAQAAAKKPKPRPKSRPITTSHQITPPMLAPPSSTFSRGSVELRIKLVYAHKQTRKYTDPQLKRDIPELKHLYGFNSYKLLQFQLHKLSFGKSIVLRISQRYQVHLQPTLYNPRTEKISLRARFFYRRSNRTGTVSRLSPYATTDIRLQNNNQVAFVGPSHKLGRALIILHAKRIR
jgi:hypothetical protein